MQQIARELSGYVSEVVYVYPNEDCTGLRYFSAEREVAFCGHGTIAAMYDLIKNDSGLARDPIIRIRVGGRELLVRNEIATKDSVFISAPPPVFLKNTVSNDEVAAALRVPPGEISDLHPIAFINAGLASLLVPIRSLTTLLAIHPDMANLKEFCLGNGIEIVTVYTGKVSLGNSDYRTRVFAPIFGYLEDPATGSGNAALGYYLLDAGKWGGKMLTIEQGKSLDHPNIVKLVSDASLKQRTVFFGGNAIVRIEGEYILHS
jgi:PhzF family phenazine biosynthesis protein